MRGLIRFLLDVEAAAKVLDRLGRSRHSTWVVPVAAIACAGGMFWTAARYNLSQQMTPKVSHTIPNNITGPTSGPTVLWACDNSTATGFSDNALNDGGCWTLGPTFNGTNNLEVVSATTEGINAFWPTANALENKSVDANGTASRMVWADTADIPNAVITTLADSLEVGESIAFRWYARVHQPDSVNDDQGAQTQHPIQDMHSGAAAASACPATGCNWGSQTFTSATYSAGHYVHNWKIPPLGAGFYTNSDTGELPKDSTHRFELKINRVSLTNVTYHARTYRWRTAGEVLIYDDATICNSNSPFDCLSDSTSVAPTWMDHLSTLQAGHNGFFERSSYDFDFMYEGAFAICKNDWCGPYVSGEGPFH